MFFLSAKRHKKKKSKGILIVFIDRNGRYFEPILDYLRTREWCCPTNLQEESILREAEYYQIDLPTDIITEGKQYIYFSLWNKGESNPSYTITTIEYAWLNRILFSQDFIKYEEQYNYTKDCSETIYCVTSVGKFLSFMASLNITLVSHHIGIVSHRGDLHFIFCYKDNDLC